MKPCRLLWHGLVIEAQVVVSLEIFIQSLREVFYLIRYQNGAKNILGELKKCFAALPGIFPRISTGSEELLARMTICALQTQTTLDDDLRQIICRGAHCLHDKHLAQQLLQEADPQTLAENSLWIQILQQQNLQHMELKDDQMHQKIAFCLEHAVKLVRLSTKAVAAFQNVLAAPFLFREVKQPDALPPPPSLLDTSCPSKTLVQTTTADSSLKLDTLLPSESNMVREDLAKPEHLFQLLFVCDFCQESFSLRKDLYQHIMRIHLQEKPFRCKVCSKIFHDSGRLAIHQRLHTGEKPFSCRFCQRSFSQSGNLNVHERVQHTGDGAFRCKICQKTLISLRHQVEHTRTHTGEKPFICSVCHKGFARVDTLKRHTRTHTAERPYSCRLCNMSFAQIFCLRVHERIHTGDHTRTHTGEKPFVCSVCQKGFTQSGTLKEHSRIHSGEKLFICKVCNKSFTYHSSLRRHKLIHTRENTGKSTQTSDLHPQYSSSGPKSVQITSVSPFNLLPSAEFVCNLPEQQIAIDLSKPRSRPASALDNP